MLYLVATPIGNLGDITLRALDVLRSSRYILCEDTRHSKTLLLHYDIHKPLKSYHQFNEAAREQELLDDLRNGQQIALISDAGTPGIADPGERIVRRCVEEGLAVTAIPGSCACVAGLTISGLSTEMFQFVGFPPRKATERRSWWLRVLLYPGTTACYEAPHRLLEVLEELQALAPKRRLVAARELTKKFEEIQRGTATELLARWTEQPPRGEFVLLISGAEQTAGEQEGESLSPEEHVLQAQKQYGLSRKEAIKWVAELRAIPKRDLYKRMVQDGQ